MVRVDNKYWSTMVCLRSLDILDYVPRDLTILYLEIVDHIHKQVRGCLQNLYQSVAIHLKYVFLVLL